MHRPIKIYLLLHASYGVDCWSIIIANQIYVFKI